MASPDARQQRAADEVHAILSPRIAIITTPEVRPLLEERGIPSLAHFLSPFGRAQVNSHDSNGYQRTIRNFSVRFVEVDHIDDNFAHAAGDVLAEVVKAPAEADDAAIKTAWQLNDVGTCAVLSFALILLRGQKLTGASGSSEHETFEHPVAVMFVVSTRNPDPANALAKLFPLVSSLPIFEKGWMDPNMLRYHVILHEGFPQENTSSVALDKVQRTFGAHCGILSLPPAPLPDSPEASKGDLASPSLWRTWQAERVFLNRHLQKKLSELPDMHIHSAGAASAQALIISMLNHSIIPFMERCAAHWNENVAAPRRGFTGRLFSASKKYFGGRSSSPSAGNISPTSGGSGFAYQFSAHEAILRKLGDFAFMLRDYRLAGQVYQTAARAYSSDKAWQYYAGATEMSAICHALLGNPKEIEQEHDTAVAYYHGRCRMPLYATRATILLATVLETSPITAASVYTRMASQDADFQSALLLEQAAVQYRKGEKLRKATLYLVLAGNRFTKCSMREHAARCYAVAQLRIPERWEAMSDHVHLSLGRQYHHLGQTEKAIKEILQLVHAGQTAGLDELAFLFSQLSPGSGKVQEIGHQVPFVEVEGDRSLCVKENATWKVRLLNPMQVPISVCSPVLVVQDPSILSVAAEGGATCHSECGALLQGLVQFHATGLVPGNTQIVAMEYRLHDLIPIRVKLPSPLNITVTAPRPKLEVQWDLPSVVFESQVQKVTVKLTNVGVVATGAISLTMEQVHEAHHMLNDVAVGIQVCLDSGMLWPTSLQPQESASIVVWVKWNAASANAVWRFGDDQICTPIMATMVNLLQNAHAQWHREVLCVGFETLHQTISGTFHAPGSHPSTSLTIPPRQTVLEFMQGKGECSGAPVLSPASLDPSLPSLEDLGLGLDIPNEFLADPQAGGCTSEAGSVYFSWSLNAWSGLLHIPIMARAALDVFQMEHPSQIKRYESVLVSIGIRNVAYYPIRVRVELKSDAALVITGRVNNVIEVASHSEMTVQASCYPLLLGVQDVAGSISIAFQPVFPDDTHTSAAQEPWQPVTLESSYLQVMGDATAMPCAVATAVA